jgi:hypothetical protein
LFTIPSVGILCDPDFPSHVARNLADSLPGHIAEQLGDDREWSFHVVDDPVAAGRSTGHDILQAAQQQRHQQGWDFTVCITDLPLRLQHCPVLADVDVNHGVGFVPLPALGGIQPYRRAHQMVLQVLDELLPTNDHTEEKSNHQRRGLHSRLTKLLAPIRRETPNREDIGVRYRATRRRGRIRLLSGMVRSNTPWRLVFGMSSALAAAIATSAFGLSSSTIWQISHQLEPARQVISAAAAIALLVAWLIAAHHLWEKPHQNHDR